MGNERKGATGIRIQRGGQQVGDDRVWRAASYARLSVDDGDGGPSSSITSQQRIIDDWAAARIDVCVVERFADDGWSGSSFDRPGFKAMMQAVEQGRVDCILVKDLSRLGRNYLETGRYMERVFPAKGVRLVAVNDAYDGLDAWGAGASVDSALIAPFKNLINDFYCATTSAKIKAALAVRRRDGLYVGGLAPYGYLKDPRDHHVLVVDPVAAPVVERIFRMRAAGESLAGIAHALDADGVLPPSELRRRRAAGEDISGESLGVTLGGEVVRGGSSRDGGFADGNFAVVVSGCCGDDDGASCDTSASEARWHASCVGKILRDCTYTGMLVQGRTFKPSFRQPDRLTRPPELWACAPGACPAIVSEQLFERVQRLGDTALSTGGRRCDNPLRGLVFCGVCGSRMTVHGCTRAGKRYAYYRCAGGCRPSPRMDAVIAGVQAAVGSTDRAFLLEHEVKVRVKLVPGTRFTQVCVTDGEGRFEVRRVPGTCLTNNGGEGR